LPYEADASLHIEGTGESAWGTKFVIVASRDLQANARIIFDAAFVAPSGREAAKAVDMFVQLRPFVPGVQAVVYDTALRGVHHHRLRRVLGWMTVNRFTAAARSASRLPADHESAHASRSCHLGPNRRPATPNRADNLSHRAPVRIGGGFLPPFQPVPPL
jgi:hypothetical protein